MNLPVQNVSFTLDGQLYVISQDTPCHFALIRLNDDGTDEIVCTSSSDNLAFIVRDLVEGRLP